MDTPHKCAECGEPVEVADGEIIRACAHEGSGVIAEMEAITYGQASLE